MTKNCLDCKTSHCCKFYTVFITEEDYNRLPEKAKKKVDLNNINIPNYLFGYLTKNEKGYCNLLDMDTMLCSVHSKKPDCCKKYKEGSCVTDAFLIKMLEIEEKN